MRSVGVAVIGFCVVLAVSAGVARATGAGGGNSIATAPLVTPGVQQNGDTSSFLADGCGNRFEFWNLQLEQGDLVKITWGQPLAVDTVALWPAGTLDSAHDACVHDWSHWSTSPVMSDSNNAAGTSRVSQTTVGADGTYPLLFADTTGTGNAGAYSFTAVVLHAASVSFAHQAAIPATGIFRASVLAPDGDSISDSTLKLTLKAYWRARAGAPLRAHRLASATPTGGTASFIYNLPTSLWGKRIRLGISGAGASYQPVTSGTESVTVRMPTSVGPVLVSSTTLRTASTLLRQRIYWAGPRKGFRYELTRTQNGYVYVRYVPRGVRPGGRPGKLLIVATYPLRRAYGNLKQAAHGKAVAGPNRSIYFVRPGDPKSVLVAFPHVNYEIEIYDPSPTVARAIAADGLVRPVR